MKLEASSGSAALIAKYMPLLLVSDIKGFDQIYLLYMFMKYA